MQIDSGSPSIPFSEFTSSENRFNILSKTNPNEKETLLSICEQDAQLRREKLQNINNDIKE